jgi:carbamoyltransferase
MGLAAYGAPDYLLRMREIVRYDARRRRYDLDLDCFVHHSQGVEMTWEDGEPVLGSLWSPKMADILGPPRRPEDPIEPRHEAIAASLQAIYEDIFFALLRSLAKPGGPRALCLAGGCAFNSVANGRIFDRTDFTDVYIQAAAGDAGTALGAAAYVHHVRLGRPREHAMKHVYLGPRFDATDIQRVIDARRVEIEREGCTVREVPDEDSLCRSAAARIAEGKIVGWFQGRMEWGPRALGNRSIVADPRRPEMKDILNARIKKREPFRPFAPSILAESAGDYFERSYPDPFMIKVYPIRPEKRAVIPAVTHVDGTGRIQTVDREANPLYWKLIRSFGEITGVPVLLNTSFNENEPIVRTPDEALDCFLRTRMDVLVLGRHVVERNEGAESPTRETRPG